MGKKKRSHPNIEELLERPWCYYCELMPPASNRTALYKRIPTDHPKASVISRI